jgi:hypothetical protein
MGKRIFTILVMIIKEFSEWDADAAARRLSVIENMKLLTSVCPETQRPVVVIPAFF